MFGWFKKQHKRKAEVVEPTMTMAMRIKQLEAEGYTNQGTLDAEGPMKGATIMVRDPMKDKPS